MSFTKREDWPELGELVVASVNRIMDYGVYVTLDEYGREGFLHISEISSSWVKNIRDFVREGEKVVLKVLRVDPEKGHIDLSLRRVTKREKREKMLLWKQSKKAESLMRSVSQRLRVPIEELYEKAWVPLEKAFGTAYDGLEKAAREGAEPLLKSGIPKELAEALTSVAKDRIRITSVKVKGTLKIACTKPDGVLRIKKALMEAKRVKVPSGSNIKIYAVSPPKYRVEVTALDFKTANSILQRVSEAAVRGIKEAGGEGEFKRG
ncbi:MAG: translation initiation factor IF-2 subunit alpha [Candidatus Bathyarchaeota archaeon B63]|nr:MAG: translation initiation factor IF-2 subunit alpha [Candidatus Bathyarchaeota archaeon B63]